MGKISAHFFDMQVPPTTEWSLLKKIAPCSVWRLMLCSHFLKVQMFQKPSLKKPHHCSTFWEINGKIKYFVIEHQLLHKYISLVIRCLSCSVWKITRCSATEHNSFCPTHRADWSVSLTGALLSSTIQDKSSASTLPSQITYCLFLSFVCPVNLPLSLCF